MADADAMCAEVAARTLACADDAVTRRGRFVVVLAGGNTPRGVYELLRGADADWSRWHVYLGDERCAPRDDPERNSLMAATAWLDHVSIPASQIHPIPAEMGPVDGARRYAATLDPVGEFDLVHLGLGEDGHTASLFPGHDLGRSAQAASALPGARRAQAAARSHLVERASPVVGSSGDVRRRRRRQARRRRALACERRHSGAGDRADRGRRCLRRVDAAVGAVTRIVTLASVRSLPHPAP